MFDVKKRTAAFVAVGAAVSAAFLLAGCSPQVAADTAGAPFATDAPAYEGEYVEFNPEKEAETTGGAAIEGSEEEQLQQERIAGGAVGAVVSKNLEPLEGITDSRPGAYSGDTGIYGQPPARHEFSAGCLGCHDPETMGEDESVAHKPMPASHVGQGLSNEDCTSCHQER